MPTLIVANSPKDWPFQIPNVEVLDAWSYLTRPEPSDSRGVKLFNFCRSYRYQSAGYYVSLLGEARGHRPMPSVSTIQDLKSPAMVRLASEDLDALIQRSLAPILSATFTLSIYFGQNLAKRYRPLSLRLFNMFQAPLLRAQFTRTKQKWRLRGVTAIAASQVPPSHRPFVVRMATEHFAGRRSSVRRPARGRYDLAILCNAEEENAPSDARALQKFAKAGAAVGFNVEQIDRDDYARVSEYDALFIRETTAVNHHTYRFARRAASEGLVVIDDPRSIARTANKVYLAEALGRHQIPTPKTLVIHRGNEEQIIRELGFPCVLKKPDSAFSLGVVKADNANELDDLLSKLLADSDLIVAQEFLPTQFDWRIGVLDGRPLYACKYYMARKHWQIVKRDSNGAGHYGRLETLPVEMAPARAVRLAVKAANLIGDGLYGVDVKQSQRKFYVIEVNDNPNLDAGCEDKVLKEELYRRIMEVFLHRVERAKSGRRIS
ncbi:MAG: RimK family protein [Planctomycetia bacterium]|nr:RimK family protein [Planctomycetia bacterium]